MKKITIGRGSRKQTMMLETLLLIEENRLLKEAIREIQIMPICQDIKIPEDITASNISGIFTIQYSNMLKRIIKICNETLENVRKIYD